MKISRSQDQILKSFKSNLGGNQQTKTASQPLFPDKMYLQNYLLSHRIKEHSGYVKFLKDLLYYEQVAYLEKVENHI